MHSFFIYIVTAVFWCVWWGTPVNAQIDLVLPDNIGEQLFLDANNTAFNPSESKNLFEGDVVAIGAGVIITADRIQLDRQKQILTANGHVFILSQQQVFSGDSVTYLLESGDFKLTEAQMIFNDKATSQQLLQKLLGFSAAETKFETERQKRLAEIASSKAEVRRLARQELSEKKNLSRETIQKYSVLIEEEQMIKDQVSPSLAQMGEERRSRIQRRRQYWESTRKQGLAAGNSGMSKTGYFKLSGEAIARTNENDFHAFESSWTSCRCEEDEAPAWGFHADRTHAQMGGYASFYHAIFEIKGVPVLYLPYMRIPIKNERQSGFLPPSFSHDDVSGNIFSQPFYWALSPSSDATFKMDIFQHRGTRLGSEWRIQERESTGWHFNIEAMRDELWGVMQTQRQVLQPIYQSGLMGAWNKLQAEGAAARDGVLPEREPYYTNREYASLVLSDPDYWSDLVEEQPASYQGIQSTINRHLYAPRSFLRGSMGLRGVTYLAPRLSVVANATLMSDHRYQEDLYVTSDFNEIFYGKTSAQSITRSAAQLHLDARDFYLGLGSRFGDNKRMVEQYQGHQVPAVFKVQSRYFQLFPQDFPVNTGAQLSYEQWRINSYQGRVERIQQQNIGKGVWQRLQLKTTSPLFTGVKNKVIQISHFLDAEARYIAHPELHSANSEIRSWKTGFVLNLPIDGKGILPDFLQPELDETLADEGAVKRVTRYGHHIMDWRVRFSMRPSVIKRGPYANSDSDSDLYKLAYFDSDILSKEDSDIPSDLRMTKHKQITLSTHHLWRFFSRDFKPVEAVTVPSLYTDQTELPSGDGQQAEAQEEAKEPTQHSGQDDVPQDSQLSSRLNSEELARQELLYSLADPRNAGRSPDLSDQLERKWQLERFELVDKYERVTPATFNAYVTYDFQEVSRREEDLQFNRGVDQEIAALQETLDDYISEGVDESLQRQMQQRINSLKASKRALAKPWLDPKADLTLRLEGWQLRSEVMYDVYAKQAKTMGVSLLTPTFAKTNLSFGYEQSKDINLTLNLFKRSTERRVLIATSLIPSVTGYLSLKKRDVDDIVANYKYSVYVAYGFEYLSPSECWGIQFSRTKEYDKHESEAEYLLKLNIIFGGEKLALPDMAPGLVRYTRRESTAH